MKKRLQFYTLGIIIWSFAAQLYGATNADSGTTPLAKEHSKFLGNIIPHYMPANFDSYWNQVTPENAGKWGSVEWEKGTFNWDNLDRAYNHAKKNGYKFKYHTLVWGSQEPSWLKDKDGNPILTPNEQLAKIELYMKRVAQRYPDIDYIDVVNEPLPGHAPVSGVKAGLGGDGSTGWDWVVKSFELARKHFPNAKLHINDYHIMAPWGDDDLNNYLKIINILKSKGLIDGIGIQSHQFNVNHLEVPQLREKLKKLGATGLPIHVSELDITGRPGSENDEEYKAYRQKNPEADEETQYQRYRKLFPVFWENEAVIGITLWGYIEGATWTQGSGLINPNGSERKALTWLKEYMASDKSKVPNKFEDTNSVKEIDNIELAVYPNPATDVITISSGNNVVKRVDLYDIAGRCVKTEYNSYIINVTSLQQGIYVLLIETESGTSQQKIMKR